MDIARDEIDASAALPAEAAGELVAQLAAARTPAPRPGKWLDHTISSASKPEFVDVDPAELDDEQRRWLPNPIPADVKVTRCTGCGDIRADVLPGKHEVTWDDHDKGCPGPVLSEAIAAALLASEHFTAAEADLDTDIVTAQTTSGLRFTLTLGVASPPFADGPATVDAAPALEIPEFDRSWRPEEITGWLDCLLNSDQPLSDDDVRRAKQAVSKALGVDD